MKINKTILLWVALCAATVNVAGGQLGEQARWVETMSAAAEAGTAPDALAEEMWKNFGSFLF